MVPILVPVLGTFTFIAGGGGGGISLKVGEVVVTLVPGVEQ